MDDFQKNQIEKFISNRVMADAIYHILLNTFLDDKKTVQEVNILAAARLAVTFLREGWKELEKYKAGSEDTDKKSGNVGL